MADPVAKAKKNGAFGYKAVVDYGTRTHIPVRKNFPTLEEARAYAQKFIDANRANYERQMEAMESRNRARGSG